jgi:hypothetical protein
MRVGELLTSLGRAPGGHGQTIRDAAGSRRLPTHARGTLPVRLSTTAPRGVVNSSRPFGRPAARPTGWKRERPRSHFRPKEEGVKAPAAVSDG